MKILINNIFKSVKLTLKISLLNFVSFKIKKFEIKNSIGKKIEKM